MNNTRIFLKEEGKENRSGRCVGIRITVPNSYFIGASAQFKSPSLYLTQAFIDAIPNFFDVTITQGQEYAMGIAIAMGITLGPNPTSTTLQAVCPSSSVYRSETQCLTRD